MDPSLETAEEVAARLRVDPATGLRADEVDRRRRECGPNELRGKPPVPAWRRFLAQFADPLIYLLLAAIAISMVAWYAEGAAGVPVDALVITIIVVANAIIGFVQESRAESAVAALADMTAAHSTVLRDGELMDVASADLVPGDILVLNEGDAVGADGRLLAATSLQVQEASLTGESVASEKDAAVLPGAAGIGDRRNMVFKGTAVARGVGRAVITSTGMSTEMGRIATLLDETEETPTPLQVEIAQISRMLGGLVIGITVVVMAALAILNGVSSLLDAVDILLMGVSLAVAAVPEGLPAILSLVLAIGVQSMAGRNAVMKDLHSVETLGSVSTICSDKTGTLTKNEMTLREVVTASGRVTLTGTGYEPVGEATFTGDQGRAAFEARRVLTAGAVASNAQVSDSSGTWRATGDPTEAAFLVAQHKIEGVAGRVGSWRRAGEVPFSSERKMMSVLGHRDDEGIDRVFTKGAPDILLERCTHEQVGEGVRALTPERRVELMDAIEDLSREGYRTLGVAWREAEDVDLAAFDEGAERDLVFVGTAAIIDPPRPEAADAIKEAHRAGIRTVMITGDHPVTATRIAGDLGITADEGSSSTALTGPELDALDATGLTEATRRTRVYARVAPENKLKIVDALQKDGHIVAMTGDGVNDAPALKFADIGIAMGITGTEVTKEAGEMILGDDNYATIVAAVRQGRVIFDNIKKFLRYLLSSNMGEVSTVFLGVVFGGFIGLADQGNPAATVVPLLATQILWINLVTDSGPALAMGVDPEIDDVMARKPRKKDDRILDRAMWWQIISVGGFMGLVNMLVYDLSLPGGLVGGLEHLSPDGLQLDVARTTVFTSLVFMQLFNALNSRSERSSAFDHLFSNKWLWLSLLFGVVSQFLVVEVPLLQSAFGTVSLDLDHWLLAVGAGASILVMQELVKAVKRARKQHRFESHPR